MTDSESMRHSGPLVTLIKYFLAMHTLLIREINFRAFQELLMWFPILLCETKLLCEEAPLALLSAVVNTYLISPPLS